MYFTLKKKKHFNLNINNFFSRSNKRKSRRYMQTIDICQFVVLIRLRFLYVYVFFVYKNQFIKL